MTHNKLCPWLMQYHPWWAHGDTHGLVRTVFSEIVDTMPVTSATACVPVTFCLCWRSVTPRTAAD
jgi:hypothetical protein